MHYWMSHRNPQIRFIDCFSLNIGGKSTDSEVHSYRCRYGLPRNQPCELEPILALIHRTDAQHFFLAIFDFTAHRVHVLGSRTMPSSFDDPELNDWHWWQGPLYWQRIAYLHGWQPGHIPDIDVKATSWQQGGNNCGPHAANFARNIVDKGTAFLDPNKMLLPSLRCSHHLRLHLLQSVRATCVQMYTIWANTTPSVREDEDFHELMDDVRKIMEHIPLSTHENLRRSLSALTSSCSTCLEYKKIEGQLNRFKVHDTEYTQDNQALEVFSESENLERNNKIQNLYPKQQKGVLDWEQLSLPRQNVGADPITLPAPSLKFAAFDCRFDEYEDAPALETQFDFPEYTNLDAPPPVNWSPWTVWRDRGYRLPSFFAQNCFLDEPIKLKEHMFCVGLPANFDYSMRSNAAVTGAYTVSRGLGPKRNVLVNDASILGISEILQEAGPRSGADSSINVMYRGRTSSGNLICLDLERDSVSVDPSEISISVDIDSLAYITFFLVMSHNIMIHMKPYARSKPPLHKTNHLHVCLYGPPSQEDKDSQGGRRDWGEQRLPLSAIPHTHFGQMGDAGAYFEVLIFFPRMVHRHEYTCRWATLVPYVVQRILWSEVIHPAYVKVMPQTFAPYINFLPDELLFKTRTAKHRRGNPGAFKLAPIPPNLLPTFQSEMRQIIASDPERLGLFGSFFFLVQGRGLKLITKKDAREAKSVLETAKAEFHYLDWDHIFDRSHGELFLDIGISFYPPKCNEPLTALWRLAAVEASYKASGFTKGKVHLANTLARYGGQQAAMGASRMLQTHIIHRITYNQSYEVIRNTSNAPILCADSDLYHYNADFNLECEELVRQFTGSALERSFGARDEWRLSGDAIEEFLDNLFERAQEFLHTFPILFIPSRLWFTFLARRVQEINTVQKLLYHRNPPNLGLISGVNNFLLQCVTHSPIVYQAHNRESLALLHMKETLERFGWFTLPDLDIDAENPLPHLYPVDNAQVRKHVKASRKQVYKAPIKGGPASDEYPLGTHPTWIQLKQYVESKPWCIMRLWMWDSDWNKLSSLASTLFIRFTIHIYALLRSLWLQVDRYPSPRTLEEAMSCWTIHSVENTITKTAYTILTTDLPNVRDGRGSLSFVERRKHYFPEEDEAKAMHSSSPWKRLTTFPGYIAHYYQSIQSLDEEAKYTLHLELDVLFSAIQCLPYSHPFSSSSPGRIWHRDKDDCLVILTNAVYYQVQGISSQARSKHMRGPPPMVPMREFQQNIIQLEPDWPDMQAFQFALKKKVRYRKNQYRSVHAKGKRVPPQSDSKVC
jgi:hypothetical protein